MAGGAFSFVTSVGTGTVFCSGETFFFAGDGDAFFTGGGDVFFAGGAAFFFTGGGAAFFLAGGGADFFIVRGGAAFFFASGGVAFFLELVGDDFFFESFDLWVRRISFWTRASARRWIRESWAVRPAVCGGAGCEGSPASVGWLRCVANNAAAITT